MAKIKFGPLLSEQAHGVYARRVIFRRGPGGSVHVYLGADPAAVNQAPASERQAAVREVYSRALREWQALLPGEHRAYHQLAAKRAPALTGWNLYFQQVALGVSFILMTHSGHPVQTSTGALLEVTPYLSPVVPDARFILMTASGQRLQTSTGAFLEVTHG